MTLETNLKTIREIATKNSSENAAFKDYLKEQDAEKIDIIVHHLNDKITPQIDCLKCGNCCANLRPSATREALRKFVKEADICKLMYAESMVCKNLKDKKCTIYNDRPEECKSYPYMDSNNFINRIQATLFNYEICPIVFNIFECLKKELKWLPK